MTVAQFGRGAVPGPCCGSAMIHEPSPDPLAWEHARDQFVGSTLLSYSGTRRLACLRLCAWAAPGTPTIAKTAPTTTKLQSTISRRSVLLTCYFSSVKVCPRPGWTRGGGPPPDDCRALNGRQTPGRPGRRPRQATGDSPRGFVSLSLIHISEPTRLLSISYAVF